MNVKQVLVTIPMDAAQKKALEAVMPEASYRYIPEIDIQATTNPELTDEIVEQADVILGDVPVSMLQNCKRLQFMQLDSAGVKDYIEAVEPERFLLANATGAYGLGISETMLAMTLLLKKKLLCYSKQQALHIWKCAGTVTTMDGAIVLCIGMGNIGGEYLKKCKALGSYTIGICRTNREKPAWLDELHQIDALDTLLPRADVIALNLPDTPMTRHLLNRERMSRIKPDAILLNAGRGNVLDTMALCEMLHAGKLAGAAVDVTDPEPLPANHPLWDAPNLLITPHVTGGYTLQRTLDNIVALAIENFRRFCAGETLKNLVDFREGYAKKS